MQQIKVIPTDETAFREEQRSLQTDTAVLLVETAIWEGRLLTVTWDCTPGLPPRKQTTQASGVCYTSEGRILLVGDGKSWSLPGGHPEEGETIQEALRREVREEACALVERCVYLGTQRVDDPAEAAPYFQTRWWAQVTLQPFEPKHEMTARRLIAPDELVAILGWDTAQIAQAILEAAQAVTLQTTHIVP